MVAMRIGMERQSMTYDGSFSGSSLVIHFLCLCCASIESDPDLGCPVVTVLHYAYRRHRYYLILSRIKKMNPTYRHRQAQLRAASGRSVDTTKKKKKNKKGAEEEKQNDEPEQDDMEPEIKLMGIRPPGWRDLVVVRLALLPWTIARWTFFLLRWIFWYKLLRKTPPPVDYREMIRERLGLSKAEFEEWEREMKAKQERANRYNRGRR